MGNFDVFIGDPYPVFVHLRYKDADLPAIPHNELDDLLYAVKKAKKLTKLKLGEDKDEV